MIRTLIDEEQTERLETRTEVYQKFIQHILSKHEPNVPFDQERPFLARKIERGLCTLAYRALAEPQPQMQRIEADLVYESVPEESVANELPRFGLVNRIFERGQHFFLFTHQSFQEFLVARYVTEEGHQRERDQVLGERWNPKWEQVIRFLAGLKGAQILEALLAGQDNVIHADLFLTASCAPEVKTLSPANLTRIAQRLVPLLEVIPFRDDALRAPSALGRVGETLDPCGPQ